MSELEQLREENKRLKNQIAAINKATYSHIDGRDLFADICPRNTLDIKRRFMGEETWHDGDWLSNLYEKIKKTRE